MDYKAFYAEVANWIEQCNKKAIKHGMGSTDFWSWVMSSIANICEKYQNNSLVQKQMLMLVAWLETTMEQTS